MTGATFRGHVCVSTREQLQRPTSLAEVDLISPADVVAIRLRKAPNNTKMREPAFGVGTGNLRFFVKVQG